MCKGSSEGEGVEEGTICGETKKAQTQTNTIQAEERELRVRVKGREEREVGAKTKHGRVRV